MGTNCTPTIVGRYHNNSMLYKSYNYGQTWHCLETPVNPAPLAPPAEIPEPGTFLLLASGLPRGVQRTAAEHTIRVGAGYPRPHARQARM